MGLNLHPHEYRKVGGKTVQTAHRPYVAVYASPGPRIFIQGGRFYTAGGSELSSDRLPNWFWDEVDHLTESAKEAVGLKERAGVRNSDAEGELS